MKNRGFLICYMIILLIRLPAGTLVINASGAANAGRRYLNITTVDNRPISIDRLLHTALNDIDCGISVTSTASLEQSYELANSGERDGVISSTPPDNMLNSYANLRLVNAALEQNVIIVLSRNGEEIAVNAWDDLAGRRVGILTGRVYIQGQMPESAAVTAKETTKLVLKGLEQKEYDVVILSVRAHETFILPEGASQTGELGTFPEYLYLNKKLEYMIPAIENALKNTVRDGRAEMILSDIPIPEPNHKRTVLHIISSNIQVEREEQFSNRLKAAFDGDMSLEWYTIEFNSKRFSRDENRLVYYANLLRQDCVSRDVAAIIVSGDDAMNFIKDYYYVFFRNIPVLFYGVCEEFDTVAGDYRPYFTGVSEHISVFDTVSLALSFFPETRNIFVVNDYTTEGSFYRAETKRQLEPLAEAYNIEYNEDISCYSLFERIKGLPQDTLVFVGSYFRDSNLQYYPLNEMKRLLERDCPVPVFALYGTDADYSSIGGKSLDYIKYAEIIAGMLKRVLNGETAGNITPVTDPEAYSVWVFDKFKLDAYGIEEKALPPGSLVLNKNIPIWESDPLPVFFVFSLFVLGIAAVFFFTRYREQKELNLKDAKIREAKERLELILNTAPLAFMSSTDGVVVETNEYMKRHLGATPGCDPRVFYTDPLKRDMIITKALQGTVKNQVVELHMADDANHRFLSNYSIVEYDGQQGFILWAMDIEEYERQKDQLNKARQDLQTLLDTMPIPVRITDNESRKIVYANNICLRLFCCENPGEMLGRSPADMMPATQSDGSDSREKIDSLFYTGKSAELGLEYLIPGGEIIEALVSICNIVYNGRNSTIAIIIDMTAEKERQRMLLSATQKEKEANQLKSRFLVNMSHEIRTPMNAIIGLTDIELRKQPEIHAKEIYKKINISAKNLLEIINGILDLSKIEADKVELYEDELDLEDVLNSALLVASPRLDGKNVEFLLNASLDLPRNVIGDRTRLWQILKNFLDNSAKFTENGKIVLTAFVNDAHSDDKTVHITFIVEDTGIGMDDAQMQKLFQPYEQIKNEAQKKYSGTGLGMAISKQLVEIMGGDIKIQSEPGVGTTITTNIPFKRSPKGATELEAVFSPVLAGLNILIVDDDSLSLDIMANLLERAGVNCTLAKSGIEAMDIILERRDMGKSFDLILLDYMMDGLNGLETARQIHLALSKSPKLLMVTAYQKRLLKNDLDVNGIDNIIEKPFIPSQFISKLCAVLGFEDDDAETEEAFTKFKDANVLMCEDYRLNQEVAAGMFAQFGIIADVAETGEQGLEMLAAKPYDLIFMDLQMPVMDGYEATRIIRSDPKYNHIPIVSLTADAMKEIVDKCFEIGMNDHIAKPIEFSSLHRVFLKWLPKSKRAAAESPRKPASPPASEGLARFGGNKEKYKSALVEFTRLFPEKWEDFDEVLQDPEKIRFYVHKLKGVSGNLAEKEIYEAAIEFEASLRAGNPNRGLYGKLTDACNAAKIRILDQTHKPPNIPVQNGTAGEYGELMAKFKKALENCDPVACSAIVNAMKEKLWPAADVRKLQLLYELAKNYEYDDAINLIDSMEGVPK